MCCCIGVTCTGGAYNNNNNNIIFRGGRVNRIIMRMCRTDLKNTDGGQHALHY